MKNLGLAILFCLVWPALAHDNCASDLAHPRLRGLIEQVRRVNPELIPQDIALSFEEVFELLSHEREEFSKPRAMLADGQAEYLKAQFGRHYDLAERGPAEMAIFYRNMVWNLQERAGRMYKPEEHNYPVCPKHIPRCYNCPLNLIFLKQGLDGCFGCTKVCNKKPPE